MEQSGSGSGVLLACRSGPWLKLDESAAIAEIYPRLGDASEDGWCHAWMVWCAGSGRGEVWDATAEEGPAI
ncbi:MAG TPA: hypothetical protein VF940_00455 [Streptosporangiaceae bacterium]